MMVYNALNCTLLLQVPDCYPSKATINLESLDKNALRDESEGRRFLEYTIVGSLVKGDCVLGLILNLSL